MSKKSSTIPLIPEWPHKIDVVKLGTAPLPVNLQATSEQLRDLARRFKVVAIHAATASLVVQRQVGNHHIHVMGQLTAEVEQACIVTGDPVRNQIAEEIDAWFSDEEQVVSFARARRAQESMRADAELEILPEAEDPEPVMDGSIDLGELAAEHLALAIDPYPRSEAAKAALEADKADTAVVAQAGSRPNPFAALKDWKAGKDQKK